MECQFPGHPTRNLVAIPTKWAIRIYCSPIYIYVSLIETCKLHVQVKRTETQTVEDEFAE